MMKQKAAFDPSWEGAARDLSKARKMAPGFRYRHRRQHGNQASSDDQTPRPGQKMIWSNHLKVLLEGVHDATSSLSMLRGYENTVLKEIYSLMVQSWTSSITHTIPAYQVGRMPVQGQNISDQDFASRHTRLGDLTTPQPVRSVLVNRARGHVTLGPRVSDRPQIAFTPCGMLNFPPPKDRNVNMLPFIMGREETIPDFLKEYYPLIVACPIQESEMGKVCYLTVAEGLVQASNTQRRGGLHIEAPNASFRLDPQFVAALEHGWGMGMAYSPDDLHGGIYIASNLAESCAVWNVLIDKSSGVVGRLGEIEHLRPWFRPSAEYKIKANELIWMTDRTPHEALPQVEDGYRQFFRVVTSEVTAWYADHSTANPKVPIPDHVQLVRGNKFNLT